MAAKSVLTRASTGNFHFHLVATSFATVLQAALTPLASSAGTDFKAAVRARWT